MKRTALILCGLILSGGYALAGCPGGVCALPGAEAKHKENVTTAEMQKVVASGDAVVIDARAGAKERIPGAKVLTGTPSAEEVAKVIPSKDTPVVTYCGNTKCSLSPKLAAHLESLGYTHVREYPEGMAGWKDAEQATDQPM